MIKIPYWHRLSFLDMTSRMMSFRSFILLGATALLLTACGTTPGGTSQFDQMGENAPTANLSQAESAWKRNPDNISAAISYAGSLSQAGRYNRAAVILAPLADGAGSKNALLRTQLSEIRSSLNSYDEAVDEAKAAIAINPDSIRAQMALATAYDGLNKYSEAEAAYRKALKLSGGNDSTIMNSLALNLASQGFPVNAIELLNKAAEISPGDRDIERNIRIVSALVAQPKPFGWKNIPPPARKPESIGKTTAATEDVDKKTQSEDVVEDMSESKPKDDSAQKPASPEAVPIHNN